jgi:hypothetical protein
MAEEHVDLVRLDLDSDPEEDWSLKGDTGGSGEQQDDVVDMECFQMMCEEMEKMCIVAAAWEIPQKRETAPLIEERDTWVMEATLFKSELTHLSAGHGQNQVSRLFEQFEPIQEKYSWLNNHVKHYNKEQATKLPKRSASDAPSPKQVDTEIASSSSALVTSIPEPLFRRLKRARSRLSFEDADAQEAQEDAGAQEALQDSE